MPKLDHTGPDGQGPKTGRKLGKCHKTETELKEQGELGIGQGKRRHAEYCDEQSELGSEQGKRKRLKYLIRFF